MSTKQRTSKLKYWTVPILVLLAGGALVLPPLINLNRYQRRIADSIGNSLGRRVHLSAVTLRLLPRPGLELSNFVVDEDPAFGAEPTLYAPTVDASIRLSSLWRGRLEIGRISLDQPSLNLVRNGDGHWNIGTVLLQASHIPNAPTAQRHAGSAPRFPYIEASDARVNFKIGNEKKPFSFLNADFAMWLDSPEAWRVRMEAQPARTDLDLGASDTGLMRLEGSLRRASAIGDMPIDLQATWSNAPVGEISQLLSGADPGWRGDLQINADVKGSLYNPTFKTRVRVAGLHRREFTPMEAFNVDATCEGGYHLTTHVMEHLTCLWPVDVGHLLLTSGPADIEHPKPAFNLQVDHIPAAFGLSLLRLIRNGAVPSTQVGGTIQGHLDYATEPSTALTGDLAVSGFSLRTDRMDAPLVIPAIHIATLPAAPVRRLARKAPAKVPAGLAPPPLHLNAADLDLGGASPLEISGDFTLAAFRLHLTGAASIAKLRAFLPASSTLQAATAALAPKGSATLDLTVHGPWMHTDPTQQTIAEGTLRLENASVQTAFLPDPVEIVLAQASFFPERTIWNPVSVVFHHMPGTLSITLPNPCPATGCAREFTLDTPALDAAALQSAVMGAGEHGELLRQILSRLDQNKTQWPELHGTVHAGTFTLGKLALEDANAGVHIAGRKIEFTSIGGRALGGTLSAIGSMDATQSTPEYSFDAHLINAKAQEASKLWPDFTASGDVNVNTHLVLSGYSTDELAQSAHGTFQWNWSHGFWSNTPGSNALGSNAQENAPPLLTHFDRWNAAGSIGKQALTLENSQVTHRSEKSAVSGSIAFDRTLHLTAGNSSAKAADGSAR